MCAGNLEFVMTSSIFVSWKVKVQTVEKTSREILHNSRRK